VKTFQVLCAGIFLLLLGSAAFLASRADDWRDPRWMGVLAIMTVLVLGAYALGKIESGEITGARTH
jgi:hypothetical protein